MILFHFKKFLKKVFKWLLALFLGILGLGAFFNLIILTGLYIAKYNGKLDQLIKAGTGLDFQYQGLGVSWHNFDPGISLKYLTVHDPQNPQMEFTVNRVRVGLAIWPSILSMTPITSDIGVDGLDLNVSQIAKNRWDINGIDVGGNAGSDSNLMEEITLWLLNQKQIELTDLKLEYTPLSKSTTYVLDPVNLLWLGRDHQFKLDAGMQNVNEGKLEFDASFTPNDINDITTWSFTFNGLFSAQDFSPLFLGHHDYPLQWASGGGEFAYSGHIDQGALTDFQLNVSLNNLNLMHENGSRLGISQVDEQIYWKSLGPNQGWQLHIQPASALAFRPEHGDLQINYTPNDAQKTWELIAQNVDFQLLGQLINFWLSNMDVAQIWNSVAPMGMIDQLDIEANSNSGTLQFSGKNLSMSAGANDMFPNGWPASSVTLKSSWNVNSAQKFWQLNIASLNLSNDNINFDASGFLNIPEADPGNPYLNLQANLEGTNLDAVKSYYIPVTHISSGLSRWLNQGLVSLPSVSAQLKWQGYLHDMPYVNRPGLFHLEVDTKNSTIQPWLQWPLITNVDAKLLFNNQKFTIDATGAKTAGINLNAVHLNMASMQRGHVSPIFITTPDLVLTGEQALNYLASMPMMSAAVQDNLRNRFQLSGNLPLSLSIEIPVHDPKLPPVIATGKVVFNGNNLSRMQTVQTKDKKQTTQQMLWLQNIKGTVNFENEYLSSAQTNFGFREENFQVQILKSPVTNLHILIPSLSLYGQDFSNVNAYIQAPPDNTSPPINNPLITFEFTDPNASGTVTLTPQGNVQANLDKLMIAPLQATLEGTDASTTTSAATTPAAPVANPASAVNATTPTTTTSQTTAPTTTSAASSVQTSAETSDFKHLGKLLSGLPPITLNVKDFYYGGGDLGSLLLITNPMDDGIDVQRLLISNKNIDFDVAGSIIGHPDNDEISISGLLSGQNFGDFVSSLGYPNVLFDGSGTIHFTFGYFGALLQPLWPSFHGEIDFDVNNGKFLKVNAGIANIFGLVSFNTLGNIISLNFKDISQQGLAFDTLKGKYSINQGIAHTDQLQMTGPVANVLVQGDIDFVNQTLDQKLIVQPQVGNSVAIAAGILATPIAGAAVWVANQVLGSTVLKHVGLVYHVQGSWNKPTVEQEKSGDQNQSAATH